MQQTNSALRSGGMHQHFFRWGLISFFLVSVGSSHRKSTPRTPRPPVDPPTVAGSIARDPEEGGCRPKPTDGLPARHRAVGARGGASWGEDPELPIPPRRSVS